MPIFIFTIALLLRIILIPHPGFEADISFWKSWGLATRDFGIVEGLKVSNFNYPTPFAYTLGLMTWIYSLFKDPHNFNEYWSNTNLAFLFVSKLPSILADFGIAAIILWMTKNTKKLSLMLAAAYLLNPISLIDGAWWGQVDSLGVFIFLIAFILSLKGRPFWAGAIYMLAMMTKLQNMIYGPLFFLFIWQMLGYKGLIRAIAGATLAFFGLNIEFLVSKNMGMVVSSLTQNYDYFPWMSLNAFNLWWIVSGGHGMQVSDKLLAIGIANAKTVGLLLFSSFYLFALLQQLFQGHPLKRFLVSLVLVNGAFFLFQTQSHDRYAFPLSVFLLLLAPFFSKQLRIFAVFYTLYTVFYFYNLHTALVFNYPDNGLPLLSSLTQTHVTIIVSFVQLGLFFAFTGFVARQSRAVVWAVPIAVFVLAMLTKNLPLVTKKPVSLTKLSPYISVQGYGQRQSNMPVNGFLGWREWRFLSVQYAFYRKGIGTHANSRIDFDLGKKFRRFTTDVGIDTEAGSAGSAVFEIYGDNHLLYSSGTIGRFDLPKHAEVDVTNVRFLTLVTTDARNGITDDHTNWLNPKLWP